MNNWHEKAIKILESSLLPVPTELNEIDWKSGLSPKTSKLAQHICAFSNLTGGGLLVFGINNDGQLFSVKQDFVERTVKTLGNIAQNNLSITIQIEHAVLSFQGYDLLFVKILEQQEKPTYLRGNDIFNAYIRSAGQTVKMSQKQVKFLMASSRGISFEEDVALSNLSIKEIKNKLHIAMFFELIDKDIPKSDDTILKRLYEYALIQEGENQLYNITNLGAILFSRNMDDFPNLKNRRIIVREYADKNNRDLVHEQVGCYGYAAGFNGLIEYIIQKLPKKEKIENIRLNTPIYPKIAIRELVANALIHQDFALDGIPISIEIFSNRLSITNPGAPLQNINRLIDLPPRSRNEQLAQTMLLFGICERRGSGIDRAVEAIEKEKLPPIKFEKGESHTRCILFPPKQLSEMTKYEKTQACYQHACLLFEDRREMNNESLRERFGLTKNQSSVASRIIADTLESGLIKIANSDITSRKYATYIPHYG